MSYLQLICPVTRKRERVPVGEGEDGVFTSVESDDADALPVGWGRITVECFVRNPDVEAVREARQSALEEMNAEVQRQATDDTNPRSAQIRAELASGEAARQIQEMIEERFPAPEQETILLRATFNAVSDEAISAALAALKEAGFNFSDMGGA